MKIVIYNKNTNKIEYIIDAVNIKNTINILKDKNIISKEHDYKTFEDTKCCVGNDIRALNKHGDVMSLDKQIENKILVLEKDEEIRDNIIYKLNKNIQEDLIKLVELGIEKLEETKKIITNNDGTKQIVQKTFDELKSENLLTDEEILNHEKQKAITRLSQIDIESIRPLRSVADKTATDFDLKKLKDLDAEAGELRAILAKT